MNVRPWKRLEPLDPDAPDPQDPEFDHDLDAWRTLEDERTRAGMDNRTAAVWTRERQRRFAIETGEIEGIYRLRAAAKERLANEGLDTAAAEDQVEPRHTGPRLRELLLDELAALELMMAHARGASPLTTADIRKWHAEATRNQGDRLVEIGGETEGETTMRIRLPLVPGEYKKSDNVIVFGDTEFEFCPPHEVEGELIMMVRIATDQQHGPRNTAACGAWMHAAFNAIHPFPDGNGRTGRLLLAWVYLRRNEPPPVIHQHERNEYFEAMRGAHAGNLDPLRDFIHENAATMLKLHRLEQAGNEPEGNPLSSGFAAVIATFKAEDPDGKVLVNVGKNALGLVWRSGRNGNVTTPIAGPIPDRAALDALSQSGEKTPEEIDAIGEEVERRRARIRQDDAATRIREQYQSRKKDPEQTTANRTSRAVRDADEARQRPAAEKAPRRTNHGPRDNGEGLG